MNTKLILGAAALALALSAAATKAEAASLVNGSFEDTTNFAPDGNNNMSLGAGSTAMTGWTVIGDSLAWIGPSNPFGLHASAGSYFLDLTDYADQPPFGGVQQSFATVAGHSYRVTFDLGSDVRSGASAVQVSAAGAIQTFTSVPTGFSGWEGQTFNFSATGNSTTLALLGTVGGSWIGVDNVVVTDLGGAVVPEPASWALMIGGFGFVGAALRRRRQAAVTYA